MAKSQRDTAPKTVLGSADSDWMVVGNNGFSASNALENVSDEVFSAPKAAAPLCVCGCCRLCGDNFVEAFALFLKGRNFLASVN
jgi:hypothetical protein